MIREIKRIVVLSLGVMLLSMGSVLSVQANVGLAPWDAFNMGLSLLLNIPYGTAVLLASVIIFALVLILRERVGIGTVINVFMYGIFIDLVRHLFPFPQMQSFVPGLLMLIAGQFANACGAYTYMHIGLGCGPRDGLMVGLSKRMPRLHVGVTRCIVEATALIIGALLGAKVGIGTLVAALGSGICLQIVFRIMHFDCRAQHQEDVQETLLRWKKGLVGKSCAK